MLVAAVIAVAVTVVAFWGMFLLVEMAGELRPSRSLGEVLGKPEPKPGLDAKCTRCDSRVADFCFGDREVCGWCLQDLLEERDAKRGCK